VLKQNVTKVYQDKEETTLNIAVYVTNVTFSFSGPNKLRLIFNMFTEYFMKINVVLLILKQEPLIEWHSAKQCAIHNLTTGLTG